jgi:predicted small metal-binding protein
MTATEAVSRWSLACADAGYPCEWRVRAGSLEDVKTRFYEHAKCAHAVSQPSRELSLKIEAVARPG